MRVQTDYGLPVRNAKRNRARENSNRLSTAPVPSRPPKLNPSRLKLRARAFSIFEFNFSALRDIAGNLSGYEHDESWNNLAVAPLPEKLSA
jgi:hypothetical protein